MRPNIRTVFVLIAAFAVAGAALRQEIELRRLRATIAELSLDQAHGISTNTDSLSADVEALRPEVQRLRAEIAQLHGEKLEMTALQASMDKLAKEVSAIAGKLENKSSVAGRFDLLTSKESSVVSQAASMAQTSPDKAAAWVASLPAGDEQNQAVMAVLDRWIVSDPAAAAAWTSKFSEGPLREKAMSLIARQWGLSDCSATAGWLETLQTGKSRDAAIGAFVTSADGYDIKLALEWANRIEDASTRAARVEETARRWLREDNAAARAWIANTQLPEGLSARLLSAK